MSHLVSTGFYKYHNKFNNKNIKRYDWKGKYLVNCKSLTILILLLLVLHWTKSLLTISKIACMWKYKLCISISTKINVPKVFSYI